MSESGNTQEFSKLRSIFWPIHGFEMKKFLPMSILLFCILFVYTSVRDLKDLFIQKYAILGGAELISSLKTWFVFPTAMIVVMIFSLLVNKFGMKKTFYIICTFYALFFLSFAFFLFPNRDSIHLSKDAMLKMRETWPSVFFYIIPCLGNWAFTTFYVLAETWGSLAVGSLFWFFANQITKRTETKRFYALYSFIGNIGTFAAGGYIASMSKVGTGAAALAAFDKNVASLCMLSSVFCVLTMLVYYYIHKSVMTDKKLYDPGDVKTKKKKAHVGFMDGLKILFSNPYIFLIFMLPICYGIGMNLFEGVFKGQMSAVLTNPAELSRMQGMLSMITAVVTIILTIVSTNILRKCSWKVSAAITPISLLIMALVFFLLMFYGRSGGMYVLGMSIPMLSIWIGILADSMSKAVKYCLFDPTKSMTFIPLDEHTKAQGQGAVEVVGGRGGKAGGGIITFIILNVLAPGSMILSHIPLIFGLFLLIMFAWIFSVTKLSKQYEKKTKEYEANIASES